MQGSCLAAGICIDNSFRDGLIAVAQEGLRVKVMRGTKPFKNGRDRRTVNM